MTIENLTRITNGVGLTTPLVSSITGFAFEAKRVKHGNAYICKNEKNIKEALENGAYAIIFEDIIKIEDDEIAWIKVENIDTALFRLLRFFVSDKKLKFVNTTLLQSSILKSLRISQKILSPNLSSIFLDILESENESYLFSSSKETLKQIAPFHESLSGKEDVKVMETSTLFHSSFIYKDIYYKNLQIPPMFLSEFAASIEFLNEKNFEYKTELKPLSHFEPLFVDKSLRIHPFGSKENALIVESDEALFEREITYIKENFSSLKLFTCKPKNSTCKEEVDFIYEDESELKSLNVNDFRYALILGNKEKIEDALNTNIPIQASLF